MTIKPDGLSQVYSGGDLLILTAYPTPPQRPSKYEVSASGLSQVLRITCVITSDLKSYLKQGSSPAVRTTEY